MKRLILSGLSVLLVFGATAPAFAYGKVEGSNQAACQSIPLPSPSGAAYLQRLQAIQRCNMEVRSRGPQPDSSSRMMQSQAHMGAMLPTMPAELGRITFPREHLAKVG